jgi:NTP pyrophosphatase (non-canonical NTP hydrolase)
MQPALVGLDLPVVEQQPPVRSRPLDFVELAQWTERQVGWIAAKSRTDRRSDLFLFTQAAKLVEEVGELHAELLGLGGRQRDKGTVFDKTSLAEELADVAICLAILAQTTGVDVGCAVRAKMQKVDDRVKRASLRWLRPRNLSTGALVALAPCAVMLSGHL